LNDATIVAEERLRPFRKGSSGVKTQHMICITCRGRITSYKLWAKLMFNFA
jgi:hypothetical protein